tara:strand:+ start:1310 stop:1606 length:297 start_codon:yes stop_codon:yes gene_type:complete
MLNIFKVSGDSMLPKIKSGDLALVTRILRISEGDIIAYRISALMVIIKRVQKIYGEKIIFASDNVDTESCFCQVPLPRSSIVGKVFLIFRGFSVVFTK